jgi:hypothetical protein
MLLIQPETVEATGHAKYIEDDRVDDPTDGEDPQDAIGCQKVLEDS